MKELGNSLDTMGFAQLVLAYAFLVSYALALGGLLGWRGRGWAAFIAAVSACGFVAMTPAWERGVLLIALAVVSVGFLVAASWLVNVAFDRRPPPRWAARFRQAAADSEGPSTISGFRDATPRPSRHDGVQSA